MTMQILCGAARCGLVGSVVAACASVCVAAPVAIVNPGFEDFSVGVQFNEFTFGPPAGWSLHDPLGITGGGAGNTFYVGTLRPTEMDPVGNPGVYENFPDGAAEGIRVAIAFNFEGSGGLGEYGLVQTLGATLAADTTYTLEVEVGNIASGFAVSGDFFPLDGFPGYRVELLAGGVVVASDNNTLAGTIGEGAFATSTVVVVTDGAPAQLGQPLGVRLVNLNVVDPVFPDSDLEVDFDDVRLDATPNPVCPDVNGDGVTNASDFTVLAGNFGSAVPVNTAGDLNGDGVVNAADFTILAGAFGCGA
jgi:hypothetical protein